MRLQLAFLLALLVAPLQADPTRLEITVAGVKRWTLVESPKSLDPAKKIPLVIALHGGGGNPQQMLDTIQDDLYTQNNILLVAPAGTGRSPVQFLTWNAVSCCGYAKERKIDDVEFIKQLIAELLSKYPIDPQKIYIAGHSNGATLGYKLACDLQGTINTVFANSAPSPADSLTAFCPTQKLANIVHIHGAQDKCALYEGGANCGGCFEKFLGTEKISKQECYSVKKLHSDIAQQFQCKPPTVTQNPATVSRSEYSACQNNFHLNLWYLAGSGHAWPGKNESNGFCSRNPKGYLCRKWRSIVGEAHPTFDLSQEIIHYIQKN